MSEIELQKSLAVLEVFKDDQTPLGRSIMCVAWNLKEAQHKLARMEAAAVLAKRLLPEVGWRGKGENDRDDFYCEFCSQTNADWSEIIHSAGCLAKELSDALAALEEAK